jgi:hypothetical protein
MGYTDPITVNIGDVGHAADWNTYIRDNFRSSMHLLAYKSADESVTSSSVLQNDDNLLFAMGANDIWYVNVGILFFDNSSGVANIKVAFTIPSGSLALYNTFPAAGSLTVIWHEWRVSGTSENFSGTNTDRFVNITGTVKNGATPGNFQMQWAQNTSNGSAVTVKIGSNITGFKLA